MNIRTKFYPLLALILILFLYLATIKKSFNRHCLIHKENFLNAIKLQKQGIVIIRDSKNLTNYDETLANIPLHFNKIWEEQFNALEPLQLKAEDNEKKFFLRFKNITNPDNDCMIVTMGVGHTVQAELELKKNYPQCKFLALDPDSEINADLVENKLNGTFIKRGIVDEDSYTAQNGAHLYVEGEGTPLNKPFNEPPIGFFDFFLYYNSKTVIDLLILDIEGSEFAIFQIIAEQYDQLPIILCQFNIEFHHDDTLANSFLRHRFFRNFNTFLRNSRFALIKTDSYGQYYRMFFVNFVDNICVNKFLC